jgi:hypothetical protein
MPGIKINTSAADFAPIEQLRMMQFKNGRWVFFGDTLAAGAIDQSLSASDGIRSGTPRF